MKAKYIELVPRKHTKIFEDRHEAVKYWEKRFHKFSISLEDSRKGKNPKDFFDSVILTLNKDGKLRKQTITKPLTKKQKKAYKKAMKLRSNQIKEMNKLKQKIEEKLNFHLNKLGYKGKVNIKYFRIK